MAPLPSWRLLHTPRRAAVVALDAGDAWCLLRQYRMRPAAGCGLPAGKLDGARRRSSVHAELEEEAGMQQETGKRSARS